MRALALGFAIALIAMPAAAQVLTGNAKKDAEAAAARIQQRLQGGGAANTTAAAENIESQIAADLAKPFQQLASFINSDAAAAIVLSTAIPQLQDGHGQQCWMAMSTFTAVLQAHPIPVTLHAMTDLEAFRLANMAANQLCANAHCTVVFTDLSNAVTSAAAQAGGAITAGLQIPSLNSLCSRIPQITVAPPVANAAPTVVTAPTPATPAPPPAPTPTPNP